MNYRICVFLFGLSVFSSSNASNPHLPDLFQFAQVVEELPFRIEAEPVSTAPDRRKLRMIVDGVTTDALFPKYGQGATAIINASTYRITERFFWINDRNHNIDFVWDRQEKELRKLPAFSCPVKTSLGVVRLRWDKSAEPPTTELCDFDFASGKSRLLYRGSGGVVGVRNDGLLLGTESGAIDFQPSEPPVELEFDLEGWAWASGSDAVRGDRVLLTKAPLAYPAGPKSKYYIEVAVLDLNTKEIKEIGDFPGGWREAAAFHPCYSVRWITAAEAEILKAKLAQAKLGQVIPVELPPVFFAGLIPPALVVEETETIVGR